MELQIEQSPGTAQGVHVLRLNGPMNVTTLFTFQELARNVTSPVLIVDLTGVPYMDSAALGSLLGVHVSCQRHGRKCAVIGVSPRITSLLRMSHVDDFLIVHTTLAEAESSLAG